MILSEIIVNQSFLQALNIDDNLMTGWFDTLKNLKSTQTLMNIETHGFLINNLNWFSVSFNDSKVLELIKKKTDKLVKSLIGKLGFKEINIPIIDKPNHKILYKSDGDILTAKEYFKDVLLKKSEKTPVPAAAPEEKENKNDISSILDILTLGQNIAVQSFIYQKLLEQDSLVNTCINLYADSKTTLPMEYSKQFFISFDFKNYEPLWLQHFFISKVKEQVEIDFDRIRSYDYSYILPLAAEFNLMYKSLNLSDCFFLIAALYEVDFKDISLEKFYLLNLLEIKQQALNHNNQLIESHIKTTNYIDSNLVTQSNNEVI
jgi:hypothetical protein